MLRRADACHTPGRKATPTKTTGATARGETAKAQSDARARMTEAELTTELISNTFIRQYYTLMHKKVTSPRLRVRSTLRSGFMRD